MTPFLAGHFRKPSSANPLLAKNFGPLWANLCVCVVCVYSVCPLRWTALSPLAGFPLNRPKNRAVFPSATANSAFFLSRGSLLVGLWLCFKAMAHPKSAFGFLRNHFVKPLDLHLHWV